MYLPIDENELLLSGSEPNISKDQFEKNIVSYRNQNAGEIGFSEAFTDGLDYAIALSRSDSEETVWRDRLNEQAKVISDLTGETDSGISDRLFKAYAGVRGDLITPDDLLGDKELEDREKRIWELKQQFPDRAADIKTREELRKEIQEDLRLQEQYFEQSGLRTKGFLPNTGRFLGLAAGTLTDMPNVAATVGGIALAAAAPPVAGGAFATMASRAALEFALNTAAEGTFQARNIQPFRERLGLESGFVRGATEAVTAGLAAGGLTAAGELGVIATKSLLSKFRATIPDPTPAEALAELHLAQNQAIADNNPFAAGTDEVSAMIKGQTFTDQTVAALRTGDYSLLPNLADETFSNPELKDGVSLDEYIAYIKEGEALSKEQMAIVSKQIDETAKDLPNIVNRYFNNLRNQEMPAPQTSRIAINQDRNVSVPDVTEQLQPEGFIPQQVINDLNIANKVVNDQNLLNISRKVEMAGEKLIASARKAAANIDQKLAKISDTVSAAVEPSKVASKAERIGAIVARKTMTVPDGKAIPSVIRGIEKSFDVVGHVNNKNSVTSIIKNKDGTFSAIDIKAPEKQIEPNIMDENYIPIGLEEKIDPLTGQQTTQIKMQSLRDIIADIDTDEATIKAMAECKI